MGEIIQTHHKLCLQHFPMQVMSFTEPASVLYRSISLFQSILILYFLNQAYFSCVKYVFFLVFVSTFLQYM